MSWGKIKIDAADKLFSKYIRSRDGRCVICFSMDNLTCSHYHSRRKESVRFDTDNCDTLCVSCHQKMENEKGFVYGVINGQKITLPKHYTKWKQIQLGMKRFNALEVRANTFKKKDRKFEILRIKEMMK